MQLDLTRNRRCNEVCWAGTYSSEVCGLENLFLLSLPSRVFKDTLRKKASKWVILFAENYTQVFYLRNKNHIFIVYDLHRAWRSIFTACSHLTQILCSFGKWFFFSRNRVCQHKLSRTQMHEIKNKLLLNVSNRQKKKYTRTFPTRSQILHRRSTGYAQKLYN